MVYLVHYIFWGWIGLYDSENMRDEIRLIIEESWFPIIHEIRIRANIPIEYSGSRDDLTDLKIISNDEFESLKKLFDELKFNTLKPDYWDGTTDVTAYELVKITNWKTE